MELRRLGEIQNLQSEIFFGAMVCYEIMLEFGKCVCYNNEQIREEGWLCERLEVQKTD